MRNPVAPAHLPMSLRRLLPVLLLLAPGLATGAPDVAPFLAYEAPVIVADDCHQAALVRLPLPDARLLDLRADLADLRLYDRGGAEMGYSIDGAERLRPRNVAPPAAGEVVVTESRQEEVDGEAGTSVFRETYEITLPPGPDPSGVWELIFESRRRHFVRSLRVEAVGRWGERLLLEGSPLFRLRRGHERLRLRLPRVDADRLRLTLDGVEGPFLQPRIRLLAAAPPAGPVARVPLEILWQLADGNQTVIEVARPAAWVPDALVVETSTAAFSRHLEVIDVRGLEGEGRLGDTTLLRAAVGPGIEALDVTLAAARGGRLRLVIDDAGAAPLADLRVSAEIRGPGLVFAAPEGCAAAALRYGGGRVAVAGAITTPGPGRVVAAELGAPRPNPLLRAPPALALAGAEGIDPRLFRRRRALRLQPSRDGLARFRVEVDDLAAGDGEASRIRVVDARGRVWPSFAADSGRRAWVDLAIGSPLRETGVARFPLALAPAPLPVEGLALRYASGAEVNWLDYRLIAIREPLSESALGAGRLGTRAAATAIAAETRPVRGMALAVAEGQSPFALGRALAKIPLPDLVIVAPAGEYQALYGEFDTAPPPALAGDQGSLALLLAQGEATAAGAIEPNPSYGRLAAVLAEGSSALRRLAESALLALGGYISPPAGIQASDDEDGR